MLYLLDANALIDANRDYYPPDLFPDVWDWLVAMGRLGSVKVPQEVYEKVTSADDTLSQWLKDNKEALLLDEEVSPELVSRVTEEGYAADLSDVETEKLNEDPFLVAYAMADIESRCVVTTERSRTTATRANRKLPDVCRRFEVTYRHTFQFIRELDFSTDWRTRL